jgi:phosphopantetheine adenylyltransferase
METLARPEAERAFAEGRLQEERATFMGDLAASQSAAYQGELQRTSMIMAADMARDHNARVLERIGRERLALQEAERQTNQFNQQLRAQIESDNMARRVQAEQFNAQARMQVDQFNAQLRQAAATAAASRGTSLQNTLSDIQSAIATFGVASGNVGPALAAAATGVPVELMRQLMKGAEDIRTQNLYAQIGQLPPGTTGPLAPGPE